MNRRRGSTGFGVNPISFSEIESFFTLNKIQYFAEEVLLIELLDNIALEHFAKEQEKNKNNNKKK